MAMPTCAMQKPMGGFCGMSKSLGRAPQPMASVRLKPLGSLGMDRDLTIHGDEATVSLMSSLGILWGADVPTAWDMPADAVSWRWNVRTGVLTTVHADGSETTRIARTWQSLAVAIDVLESHAFVYFFDAASYASAFLVASRELSARKAWSIDLLWGEVEKYLTETFHIFFTRLQDWLATRQVSESDAPIPNEPHGKPEAQENRAVEELRQWLLAEVRRLIADGVYPRSIYEDADALVAVPKKDVREAVAFVFGKYVFAALLTMSLFMGTKNLGKPCYEPWMLWQMFKWISRSTILDLEEKIFDLSPNWG